MRLRHNSGDGIQIEGVSIPLDAGRVQPTGIVTHAHTDHAAHHKSLVCTPETSLLLSKRWQRFSSRAVPYRKATTIDDVRFTFYPAGHILGSAMVLVEHKGVRILYTGDLRTIDGPLHPGAQPISCDILIIESTFAKPEYVFPTLGRIKQLMKGFVDSARASGYTPVMMGYALGKAQEIVSLLGEYHETIWVHPKIADFCDFYRQAGVKLPAVEIPSAGAPEGALVVMPPGFMRSEWRDQVRRPRTCFCSGWAMAENDSGFVRADQMIPLSDHADLECLVDFARATGAAKVFTIHGFTTELAQRLCAEGMDATAISGLWQSGEAVQSVQYSSETLDLFNT